MRGKEFDAPASDWFRLPRIWGLRTITAERVNLGRPSGRRRNAKSSPRLPVEKRHRGAGVETLLSSLL